MVKSGYLCSTMSKVVTQHNTKRLSWLQDTKVSWVASLTVVSEKREIGKEMRQLILIDRDYKPYVVKGTATKSVFSLLTRLPPSSGASFLVNRLLVCGLSISTHLLVLLAVLSLAPASFNLFLTYVLQIIPYTIVKSHVITKTFSEYQLISIKLFILIFCLQLILKQIHRSYNDRTWHVYTKQGLRKPWPLQNEIL